MKDIKNADLAMILLDVTNNRPILDGTTVFLGDQVLIDIKAPVKGEGIQIKARQTGLNSTISADF